MASSKSSARADAPAGHKILASGIAKSAAVGGAKQGKLSSLHGVPPYSCRLHNCPGKFPWRANLPPPALQYAALCCIGEVLRRSISGQRVGPRRRYADAECTSKASTGAKPVFIGRAGQLGRYKSPAIASGPLSPGNPRSRSRVRLPARPEIELASIRQLAQRRTPISRPSGTFASRVGRALIASAIRPGAPCGLRQNCRVDKPPRPPARR